MTKFCQVCGTEGGMLEVRKRKLPLSGQKILCKKCYNELNSKEQAELNLIYQWKETILRRFYEGALKQFCREAGVSVSEKRWTTATSRRGTRYKREYTHYFTYEELINRVKASARLDTIIDFAKRKKVPIREVESEIDKYYANKDFVENQDSDSIDDEKYKQVLDFIHKFNPIIDNYPNELPYQIDLARYLMQYFPETKVELQKGSARPDIIIDNIAIEIKGPTWENGLQSIADKCLRYPQYFERGFIIVLFDVKVTNRFFNDWSNGIKQKFPEVIILKK